VEGDFPFRVELTSLQIAPLIAADGRDGYARPFALVDEFRSLGPSQANVLAEHSVGLGLLVLG
jgi:hypothetical protein